MAEDKLNRQDKGPVKVILSPREFWSHAGQVLDEAFRDFGLGRDMIISGAIALSTLALQVVFRLISATDWSEHKWQWIISVVGPFGLVLGTHASWRLATAPARLCKRLSSDNAVKAAYIEALEAELAEAQGKSADTMQLQEKLSATESELTQAKQTPAEIEVSILELQREPIDFKGVVPGGSWRFDIFVRARVELKNLVSLTVACYGAELSLQGALEHPEELKDIDRWQLFVWKINESGSGWTFHGINPLSHELKKGVPVEGWLHFITKRTTEDKLDQASFALIVETERGAGNQYLKGNTDKWMKRAGQGRIVKITESGTLPG